MKHKRHQKDKRDRDDRVGRYHSEINSNTVYTMKDISHDGNDDPTHPKKLIIYIARTDINSQSTPAAATPELNIQNVNPNVIHSSTSGASAVVTSNASSHITSPPVSTQSSSSTSSLAPANKSQVITQNVHAKTKQQDESLVVSVPLSSATTVPGIQLPTNSSNTSSSNNTTIVTNQNQAPTASPVSSSSLSSHGSLYQHLTNNQAGSQRSSPLVGRASPIVPTGSSSLAHESHSNHTSVLQNMNSGVIASSFNDTSPTMHKVQTTSRIHALQEEAQSGRRSRTPDMSASSNASSTGGLKFAFEPQSSQAAPISSGLVINTQAFHPMKDSPPSSPGSEASARKRRKATPQQSPIGNAFDAKRDLRDDKDTKTLQNGAIPGSTAYPTHHMLGNQINPASSAAKTMTETLNMEIEAHSIYTTDLPQSNLIGPQYPGRKDSNKTSSNSSSTTTSSGPASLTSMLSGSSTTNGAPQSLEQLLERQWEQGSQFLMEQAQHFDIASLLSCLHQLKIENSRLEDHINGLVSRRDHLLAVNARLAIPLGQPTTNQATHNGPVEPPPSQQQSQQAPPPQQAPQSQVTNKRSVPANPASTIQAPPMENGLDYRGHHAISSSSAQQQHHQPQSRESHQSQHPIRHSPAASKGNLISPQVVAIDAPVHNNPQPNLHQPQQQQPSQPFQNAQFPQQMYHHQQPQAVASHVNSIRGRQTNSYQSQQSTSISSYPPPNTVHKTKN